MKYRWQYSDDERRRLYGDDLVIGVIPDTHIPFQKEGALESIIEIFESQGVNMVIHIGDIIDALNIPSHGMNVHALSFDEELKRTKKEIQRWFKVFPYLKLVNGNHDLSSKLVRWANKNGIHDEYIKSQKELLEYPPGWDVRDHFIINDVLYMHGHKGGNGGQTPAYTTAKNLNHSIVVGHFHSKMGVQYHSTIKGERIFGMNVGCLVDSDAVAFGYKAGSLTQDLYGVGIVYDSGTAIVIPID